MHATKRQALKRQMDKVTKEHKKLKRRELFQQAHEASQARDTRRFFGLIRKLSPKMPRKQIHLRKTEGTRQQTISETVPGDVLRHSTTYFCT